MRRVVWRPSPKSLLARLECRGDQQHARGFLVVMHAQMSAFGTDRPSRKRLDA